MRCERRERRAGGVECVERDFGKRRTGTAVHAEKSRQCVGGGGVERRLERVVLQRDASRRKAKLGALKQRPRNAY